MSPEELSKLQTQLVLAVQDTVRTTVNGKIDKLQKGQEEFREQFSAHMEVDKLTAYKLENHIAGETERWKSVQPLIKIGTDLTGFGKVTVYILGILGTLAGIAIGLYEAIMHIK